MKPSWTREDHENLAIGIILLGIMFIIFSIITPYRDLSSITSCISAAMFLGGTIGLALPHND